mmetsp:Transcript_9782/g.23912  ORF Transcript_9782/g.23912 Transcript_9782/m.23912 type:complete len:133 (+) Transcript_9782:694-1092(+)
MHCVQQRAEYAAQALHLRTRCKVLAVTCGSEGSLGIVGGVVRACFLGDDVPRGGFDAVPSTVRRLPPWLSSLRNELHFISSLPTNFIMAYSICALTSATPFAVPPSSSTATSYKKLTVAGILVLQTSRFSHA